MTSKDSQACNTVVPVAMSGNYEEKGSFELVDGVKTYITGPSSPSKGLLFVYDVFGYTHQTIQGADILGHVSQLNAVVAIPDFFDSDAMKTEWLENPTEANQEKVRKFRETRTKPAPAIQKIMDENGYFAKLKEKYPQVDGWGVIGYCWGGKIAALTSGEHTPFKVAVQTSPSRLDLADADKVTIPMALLASEDEPKDLVEGYAKILSIPNHIETWTTSRHGFMSTRADLSDPHDKAEYERGYKVAIGFFSRFL